MAETLTKPAHERRRYFRVTDLVGLRYHALSEDQQALAIQAKPTSLKELLKHIDNELLTQMALLQSAHPEIFRTLDLLNQKINLALNAEQLLDNEHSENESLLSVNLSACGIAFPAHRAVNLNQYLSIELTLYPNNIRLTLMAAVTGCDPFDQDDEANRYLVRANFVEISDANQEVLVQHVIKRQAQQLKLQRGNV